MIGGAKSTDMNMADKDYSTIAVFSNLGDYASPTWAKNVNVYKAPFFGDRFLKRFLPSIIYRHAAQAFEALNFFFAARDYNVAVVTGSGSGLLFGMMQAILRRKKKAIPIIYLDCLYYAYPSKLKRLFKRFQLQLAAHPNNCFVCWSSRDTKNYSTHFQIPERHFRFIPYFNTLEKEEKYSIEGDYIFSGGNSDRDYPTLISAVNGFPFKIVIATSDRRWITPKIESMKNVIIKPMPYEEYTRHMKECLMNVVVLKPGLLRSAGQQTFINSMYLGKPTIICDNGECLDYINRAIDAIHISSGNVGKLRSAILSLVHDRDLRVKMSANAMENARRFTHENTMTAVLDLAFELADRSIHNPPPGQTPKHKTLGTV